MARLIVGGVVLGGDGYPNGCSTVALLKASHDCEVLDHADWLPQHVRLWHLVQGTIRARIGLILRLGLGGLLQAIGLIVRARRGDVAYLPYPAPVTLWWLSFVPRSWRPRCIADAYISLWDTMFRDRGAGNVNGALSRIVRGFEARSLRAAAVVLVDTEANRQQMVADFALPARHVRSIPLATDERLFSRSARSPIETGRKPRVLFVGTLVPLHGIDVVLAVAAELLEDRDIEFRLIGDGQQRALVEAFIRNDCPPNFTWMREWMPLAAIAREIEEADVCLGVFGGGGKAARVLPFKLYYALAAGKAIVTQAAHSLPQGLPPLPAILAAGEDREQLARRAVAAIRMLLADRAERAELGESARRYFADHLSSHAVRTAWKEILSKKKSGADV